MREMGKLFLTAIVIAAAGVNTEAQAQKPRTIDRGCISRHARRPSDTNTGASNRAQRNLRMVRVMDCRWRHLPWFRDARFGAPRR